jgi:GT2 family glycosyltransferase
LRSVDADGNGALTVHPPTAVEGRVAPPRSASVIVCTYEAPRELDLVLAALSRQSRAPDEVLVADDGSGPATQAVIEEWRGRLGAPLRHVRHADIGYRKARIVNEAVRRATGEHLLMLDGDSFPNRHWVADHLDAADGRHVLCGRRVKLGAKLSAAVTRPQVLTGRFDTAFAPELLRSMLTRDTQRWTLGVRLPAPVARVLHPFPRKLMGVNFSLPRTAFVDVNGYDEGWVVYGHEDRDLELRLQRAGWPFRALLNRAVVFHLWHRERERSALAGELLEAAERSTAVRPTRGLVGGVPFDAAT